MAGTDKSNLVENGGASDTLSLAVILVEPQMGENIGMASRAMLNCGLTDLRLVRPRDGWPNSKANNSASGADVVVDGARVFDTTTEAIADLSVVYAATDEAHQMFVPGRTADVLDLLADAGGAIVGTAACWAWGIISPVSRDEL